MLALQSPFAARTGSFTVLAVLASACAGPSEAPDSSLSGAPGAADDSESRVNDAERATDDELATSEDAPSAADEAAEAACVALPNTTVEWRPEILFGARCQVVCDAGRADCDGRRDNGCETDLSDPVACGRCVDACLTDLCGAPQCAASQADVWTVAGRVGSNAVLALTVSPEGEVLVRVNGGPLSQSEQAPAIAPGSVAKVGRDGLIWQSSAGDSRVDTEAHSNVQSRIVGTATGFFVADWYYSADVGGQHSEAVSRDAMLSWASYSGELGWSRALNLPAGVNIWGMFADEAGNAYLQIYTDKGYEFEGHVIDQDGGSVVFAFAPDGSLRWLDEGDPISVQPVSGDYFATSGLIFSGTLRSSATGEYLRDVPELTGAQLISVAGDGSLTAVGKTWSSALEQHGGLAGTRGVTINGETEPNHDALFVQRFEPSGALLWESHFAAQLTLTLYGLQVADDGSVYVLATGNNNSSLDYPKPETLFVARVGPDGQQQGAYSLQLGHAPRGAAFTLGSDNVLHVGSHYDDGIELAEPLTGAGIVGVDLRFDPL